MTLSQQFVARRLAYLMGRYGITTKRLVAHAKAFGVSSRRVHQALRGEPGWLKTWSEGALADWEDMIQTAWLA